MKYCGGCKTKKSLDKFSKNRDRKDGLQDRCKACQIKWLKEYHKTAHSRWDRTKQNAKNKKIPCEFKITPLEFEKLFHNKPCHYCGGESTGLDRVDNSKGYILKNVVPCCGICNGMKETHNVVDFIEQCKKIVRHFRA
jgi:hypothetical protein